MAKNGKKKAEKWPKKFSNTELKVYKRLAAFYTKLTNKKIAKTRILSQKINNLFVTELLQNANKWKQKRL